MSKAITFLNWTDEDFTWSWDSIPYTFPAHSRSLMEDWKVAHFARHLTDRELLKKQLQVNDPLRAELLKKCTPDEQTIEAPASKIDSDILNMSSAVNATVAATPMAEGVKKPFCDSCDSKGVSHKKDCPKKKRPVEEEFASLNA